MENQSNRTPLVHHWLLSRLNKEECEPIHCSGNDLMNNESESAVWLPTILACIVLKKSMIEKCIKHVCKTNVKEKAKGKKAQQTMGENRR